MLLNVAVFCISACMYDVHQKSQFCMKNCHCRKSHIQVFKLKRKVSLLGSSMRFAIGSRSCRGSLNRPTSFAFSAAEGDGLYKWNIIANLAIKFKL